MPRRLTKGELWLEKAFLVDFPPERSGQMPLASALSIWSVGCCISFRQLSQYEASLIYTVTGNHAVRPFSLAVEMAIRPIS